MRVCLVLPELRPAGGIGVALAHADRLRESGDFTVDVVSLRAEDATQARAAKSVDEALGNRYDVAVATWWETLPVVLRLQADARVALVQSAEERFYRDHEPLERLGAGLALAAPVHFFAVARWLQDLLGALRPSSRCWFVPNGIDKELFAARSREPRDGPLRVLIEGQHTLWFKGVADALEAVSRMDEPHTTTLVALDPADAPAADGLRVVGGLSPEEMREQYEQHDVLLKLSRIEAVGLAVVEAGHVGLPAVVAPYTGHDEIIRHGENGLVVGYDDPAGCASVLDRLARDRTLLQSLSAGAVRRMRDWPSQAAAADAFATALREVAEAPAPSADDAARAGLERWRAAAEVARVRRGEELLRVRDLEGSVDWLEGALASERETLRDLQAKITELNATIGKLNADYHELAKSRDEAALMIRQRDEELDAMRKSRTYRAARAAQAVTHRLRR